MFGQFEVASEGVTNDLWKKKSVLSSTENAYCHELFVSVFVVDIFFHHVPFGMHCFTVLCPGLNDSLGVGLGWGFRGGWVGRGFPFEILVPRGLGCQRPPGGGGRAARCITHTHTHTHTHTKTPWYQKKTCSGGYPP